MSNCKIGIFVLVLIITFITQLYAYPPDRNSNMDNRRQNQDMMESLKNFIRSEIAYEAQEIAEAVVQKLEKDEAMAEMYEKHPEKRHQRSKRGAAAATPPLNKGL